MHGKPIFDDNWRCKGVGKIYRKQGRSGRSGAGTFLNTENHGAETFFDKKNHGAHPFFPLKNHGADTFSSAQEITGRRLFLKQDDGVYSFFNHIW